MDLNEFNLITSSIAECASIFLLSPVKYIFEVKRTWSQFSIPLKFREIFKINKSALSALFLRDSIFFMSFNFLYHKTLKESSIDPNRVFINLFISIFIANFFSQPFDFVFVRICLDQLNNYNTVFQTLKQVNFEELHVFRWLSGLNFRFLYMFSYYTSMILVKEFVFAPITLH